MWCYWWWMIMMMIIDEPKKTAREISASIIYTMSQKSWLTDSR